MNKNKNSSGSGSGKLFRFVRKVRRCMTCLYVFPTPPYYVGGLGEYVKTSPTVAFTNRGGHGE